MTEQAPPPPPARLDPSVASASEFHNQIASAASVPPLKRLQNVTLTNNGHTIERAKP